MSIASSPAIPNGANCAPEPGALQKAGFRKRVADIAVPDKGRAHAGGEGGFDIRPNIVEEMNFRGRGAKRARDARINLTRA